MASGKSFFWIVFSRLFGIMVFLIILFLLNLLVSVVDVEILTKVVAFLNENLVIILAISVAFFIAELFGALVFPFNLPTPIFNAVGAVFLASFILRILSLADFLEGFVNAISLFIYPLVFLAVIVFGYFGMFFRLGRKERRKKKPKEWEEIGEEVKSAVQEAVELAREEIRGKKKRKKRKKKR